MSRAALDRLPDPSTALPMRVVGLGASRTGTLGLFQALRILDYRPFHMSELLPHGVPKMRAVEEAIAASSTDAPFARAELDKLFGGYDCLIEAPCYLGASGIRTYLDDPRVKFVLTRRSPEAFARSLTGSLGHYHAKLHEWPLNAARCCDSFVRELERMFRLMTLRWPRGLHPYDAAFSERVRQSYVEYMDMVEAMVPAERVLILDLDKGFGWEELCPFLERPIPDEEYPRSNAMAEFHVAAQMILAPAIRKTRTIVATSAVTMAGLGAWYLLRAGRQALVGLA